MKKKLITGLLAVFGSAACIAGVSACGVSHAYSEEWEKNETQHWHACLDEGCKETSGLADHTYGDDGNCTECGYHKHKFPDAWEKSDTQHWHVCEYDGCDGTSEKTDHNFNSNGTCTDCGYHAHRFSAEWSKNATEHWHAATCGHNGEKADAGAHDTDGEDGACSVCGYVEKTYTITIKNPDDSPAEGVKLSFGNAQTVTDADGIARLKVEKNDYTVKLTNTVSFTNAAGNADEETYTLNGALAISAETYEYTYTLPVHLPTMEMEPPLNQNGIKREVNGAGTYSVSVEYYNASWISFKNDTDSTKKYTVHFLDDNACYVDAKGILFEDTGYEVVSGDFDIYVRAGETSGYINFTVAEGNNYGYAFTVTAVDFGDGKIQTPVILTAAAPATSAAEEKYFVFSAQEAGNYKVTADEGVTVTYLGSDISADGNPVPEHFLVTQDAPAYFKASGEGTFTVSKTAIPGETKATAIEIEELDKDYTATFTFGSGQPNTFWFLYDTNGKPAPGKLTIASSDPVAYDIRRAGSPTSTPQSKLADDFNIQAYEFEADYYYYIVVTYTGAFGGAQTTAQVRIRNYNAETDEHEPVAGQLIDEPLEIVANGEEFTVSARQHSQQRYLKYTAAVNGELVVSTLNVTNNFYGDEAYTAAYRHFTEETGEIKVYTIYLKAGETVYYKLTSNKPVGVTAEFTAVQKTDYTVTLKYADGTAMAGYEIQLKDGAETVGTGTTGADGKYTFNVYPGKYTVKINMTEAQAENYMYPREAVTEYNAAGCDTAATLYAAKLTYTVTLSAADTGDTVDLSTVTAIKLKNGGTVYEGTSAGDNAWTFTDIPAAAYTVQLEGTLPTGYGLAPTKTSVTSGAFEAKVYKVTTIKGGSAYTAKAMQPGMTEITASSLQTNYGKFTAAEDGVYKITVVTNDCYISALSVNANPGTTGIIYGTQFKPTTTQTKNYYVADSIVMNAPATNQQVSEITLKLGANDYFFISSAQATGNYSAKTIFFIEKVS